MAITTADQHREALKAKLHGMRSLHSLTEEVSLPPDLAAALLTMRPELLMLATPRAMDADEVSKLYTLVKVLMETNIALQQWAQEIAHMVGDWYDHIEGAVKFARKVEHFAEFRFHQTEDEED